MPMFFYDDNDDSKVIVGSITQYISKIGATKLKELDKKYKTAQKNFPTITVDQGRNIFYPKTV